MSNHAQTFPHDDHDHESNHHIAPLGLYVMTLIALLVLMGTTVWASYQNFGAVWINNVVALLIASVKAAIVISIFMGVKWSSTLTKVWVASGFLVLVIMFGIFGDYWTRKFEPVAGWEKNGESAFPREFAPAENPPATNNVNLRPRG